MKNRPWRAVVIGALLTLIVLSMAGAGHAQSSPTTYKVTITNLTHGQPLTPPLVATHREGVHIFTEGEAAGSELQQVAENGNLDPLKEALSNNMEVSEVVVAVAGEPPPLLPGDSVTFTIHGSEDAQFLSFVAMLICTNDGFTGLNAVRLPDDMDNTVTVKSNSYDAGTEMNTENFADLVPPCPALTNVESMVEGTGQSNPDLAEGGVISTHAGIQGSADLDAMTHGWTDPVAEVTIERVESMMEPQMMPQTGAANRLPALPLAMLAASLLLLSGASVLRRRAHQRSIS